MLTGPERRPRWTAVQKLAMVRERFEPGKSVSLVARQHGANQTSCSTGASCTRAGACQRSKLVRKWSRNRSWPMHSSRFASCSGCSARRQWRSRFSAKQSSMAEQENG